MLKPGHVLSNRYEVIKPLGQGGQSNVYLLQDLRLKNKKWVAKEMVAQYIDPKDQALAKEHFEREANLLATLEHPNLPKVIDYFSQGGMHYLIMEYLPGEDLLTTLEKQKKPFSDIQVANWAMEIATVLYYLHSQPQPIVFRDIKPSNIMIHNGHVKLIDFGIARLFSPSKRGDTLRIGSPGYSPPEQYSGQTDPRSDIYSLGVTMHHLLTNHDPATTQTPFKLPPVKAFNPNVSSKMVAIVEKATQIDASKRYRTTLEMKNDLRDFLQLGKTSKPRTAAQASYKQQPAQKPAAVVAAPPVGGRVDIKVSDEQAKKPVVIKANKQAAKEAQAPATAAPSKAKKSSSLIKIFLFLIILSAIGIGLYAGYPYIEKLLGENEPVNPQLKKTPHISMSAENLTPLENGKKLYREGKYNEAIDLLNIARKENPGSPDALIYLSNSLAGEAKMDSLKIAAVIPETEEQELTEFLRGAAIAQQQINYEGGVKGKNIIIEIYRIPDGAGKIGGFIDQILKDKPSAIIYDGIDLESADILAKAANSQKIAVLSSDPLPVNNQKGLIRVRVPVDNQAEAAGRLMTIKKAKSAAVLFDNTEDEYKSTLAMVKKSATADKKPINISSIPFKGGDLDYSRLIGEIKRKKPEYIVIFGSSPDITRIIKSVRGDKINTKIIIPPYSASDELLEKLGNTEGDIFTVTPLCRCAENYASANFISIFTSVFKARPDLEGAYGYDLVSLIAFAGRHSFTEPERIMQYLAEESGMRSYKGASGSFIPSKDLSQEEAFIPSWWEILESSSGEWKETGGFQIK